MKMVVWLIFLHLMFLGLSGAKQEAQVLTLFDKSHDVIQVPNLRTSVSVSVRELGEVSTSVIMAETWLRTHVLAHYPSIPISTILVGDSIFCYEHHKNLTLVLTSLKNIHHSLTRWGLDKDIKLSTSFSSSCLEHQKFESLVRPILEFLDSTNSTYSVNPKGTEVTETRTRRLFGIDPFPVKPNPQEPLTASDPPLHSSVGFSVPANVAKHPHPQPPQAHTAASPAPSQTASPLMPMPFSPASPPFAFEGPPLPPCDPRRPSAPAGGVIVHRMWCVAKPSVPEETLQEAVDYACGAGGADCEEIMPSGNCYYPDSAVAHASYAFNSYWQKNKRNGGTCSFGGAAMLINSDPSYQLCRFVIT